MSCCTYWGCRQVKLLECQSSSLCTQCPLNGALQALIGWSEEVWFLVSVCAVQYICERIITPPRKLSPKSEPRDKDCDCLHVDSQTTVEVVYHICSLKTNLSESPSTTSHQHSWNWGYRWPWRTQQPKRSWQASGFVCLPLSLSLSKAWFTYFCRVFVADLMLAMC